MYTPEDASAGLIQIFFSSTIKYVFGDCSAPNYSAFPKTLPAPTEKVWRVTIVRASQTPRIVIHCNDEEVLNFRFYVTIDVNRNNIHDGILEFVNVENLSFINL